MLLRVTDNALEVSSFFRAQLNEVTAFSGVRRFRDEVVDTLCDLLAHLISVALIGLLTTVLLKDIEVGRVVWKLV